MVTQETIYIVDDNQKMNEYTRKFLEASGFRVQTYDSSQAFLETFHPKMNGCLLLDIQMPGMSGLDLQDLLNSKGSCLPVIIISGNAQVKDAVRAMKQGTFDFIEKPFEPEQLISKLKGALEHGRKLREEKSVRDELVACYQQLTDREKQIVANVVAGLSSKEIASETGVSVSTVDNHRSNIMKKLRAKSTAELVRIVLLADPECVISPHKG